MKARDIAAALLRDRKKRRERAARKVTSTRAASEGVDFDPTRWRVVAGGDPGYLPKGMRQGTVGFWITCPCGREFESRGLAYCESCLAKPAAERRALADERPKLIGRMCERPGCDQRLSKRARSDARYCSPRCARKAQNARAYAARYPDSLEADSVGVQAPETPIKRPPLIGPKDYSINIVGGHRFRGAPKLKSILAEVLDTELCPPPPPKQPADPRIVPDGQYPGMYRLRLPGGGLSDMVNLTRARDALEWLQYHGKLASPSIVPEDSTVPQKATP
jgi:hypothetical protein